MIDQRPELTGYSGRLSVAPGESIAFHVSTDAPSYDLRIVRMIHGDANRAGPGHKELAVESDVEGTYPGRTQVAHAGSFGIVEDHPLGEAPTALTFTAVIQPTTPTVGREQGIMSCWSPDGSAGLALSIGPEGLLTLSVAGGRKLTAPNTVLRRGSWYFVGGGVDLATGRASCTVRPLDPLAVSAPELAEVSVGGGALAAGSSVPLLFGAISRPSGAGTSAQATGLYNGKIEAPHVFDRLLEAAELEALATGEGAVPQALARWDFSVGMDGDTMHELVAGRHGRFVNMPARAMTGSCWDGTEVNPGHAPEQYGAVHFHDDDLADAGWAADATWTVPDDFPSGTFAARLDADGQRADYLPFVVRPRPGERAADALLVIPTMTYLAYANERLVASGAAESLVPVAIEATDYADELLAAHPEWGLSLYDVHSDGSGVCYSSRLRPIPNMRPGYRFWSTGGTERYAADLYVIDWLDHEGIACDVITDEDLHDGGHGLLEGYRTVLTGCHPEYYTGAMLDAVQDYVAGGGRLMYLGGNGFYWVTSVAPEQPHVVELRRGFNGTRAWESRAGEGHHSTTGEQGGLWRYRGRAPNRLAGVGFTAQSDSHHPAAGYERLGDSRRPEVAFVFDGVGDEELIGGFGLINDGAAGYEIDRWDPELGEPEVCLRLATSQGRHDETYLLVVEDQGFTLPNNNGSNCDLVRADMVYARVGGGEVFTVGSCNWCASLSHGDYDNNVARITGNVLRRFLRDD